LTKKKPEKLLLLAKLFFPNFPHRFASTPFAEGISSSSQASNPINQTHNDKRVTHYS